MFTIDFFNVMPHYCRNIRIKRGYKGIWQATDDKLNTSQMMTNKIIPSED